MESIATKKIVAKERRAKKIKKRNETGKVVDQLPLPSIETTEKTKPKKTITINRISKELKQRLAETRTAIFVSLPKNLKKRRSAAHSGLRIFLSGLNLRGLESITSSGTRFFAIVFDTVEHKDRALNKIGKASYKWDGTTQRLIAHTFGDPKDVSSVVWQVVQDPLVTGEQMREAVVSHVTLLEPDLVTTFTIKKVMGNDVFGGRWAIKFDGNGPKNFSKQLQVEGRKLLITQEPKNSCRFCGTSGHDIFECKTPSDKELAEKAFVGYVGSQPLPDTDKMLE